jgi:hypothetical protein
MVRESSYFNEQVFERIGKKQTLINKILRRKGSWIGHLLRRNCLLHDFIGGQNTEVKEGRIIRRRRQLLDDLTNRR